VLLRVKRYIYFLVDDLTTGLPLKIVRSEHLKSAFKEVLEKIIEEILWCRGVLEIKGH